MGAEGSHHIGVTEYTIKPQLTLPNLDHILIQGGNEMRCILAQLKKQASQGEGSVKITLTQETPGPSNQYLCPGQVLGLLSVIASTNEANEALLPAALCEMPIVIPIKIPGENFVQGFFTFTSCSGDRKFFIYYMPCRRWEINPPDWSDIACDTARQPPYPGGAQFPHITK